MVLVLSQKKKKEYKIISWKLFVCKLFFSFIYQYCGFFVSLRPLMFFAINEKLKTWIISVYFFISFNFMQARLKVNVNKTFSFYQQRVSKFTLAQNHHLVIQLWKFDLNAIIYFSFISNTFNTFRVFGKKIYIKKEKLWLMIVSEIFRFICM